jgi:hypothetical protein
MLQNVNFGNEALDYLQCRLLEDGDAISLLLLDHPLRDKGLATAQLPVEVDRSLLYRFRTDIFWGWPDHRGREISQELVTFMAEFLSNHRSSVVISETWLDSVPDFEPSESHHFRCRSKKLPEHLRFCRFITHDSAAPEHIARFLQHDNLYPLILTDLKNYPQVIQAIVDQDVLLEEGVSAIAKNTAHIVVDVYDGRANLMWSRALPLEPIEEQFGHRQRMSRLTN